jgi:hypothetical protein
MNGFFLTLRLCGKSWFPRFGYEFTARGRGGVQAGAATLCTGVLSILLTVMREIKPISLFAPLRGRRSFANHPEQRLFSILFPPTFAHSQI